MKVNVLNSSGEARIEFDLDDQSYFDKGLSKFFSDEDWSSLISIRQASCIHDIGKGVKFLGRWPNTIYSPEVITFFEMYYLLGGGSLGEVKQIAVDWAGEDEQIRDKTFVNFLKANSIRLVENRGDMGSGFDELVFEGNIKSLLALKHRYYEDGQSDEEWLETFLIK